ncbi:MAG: hypothetical protein KAI66_14350 [Lentisphaeria bacterium]|nr:hypothetical protein [Lentisphaeria bacterium]
MPTPDEWRDFVNLYFRTKSLFIQAEELSFEKDTVLQPIMEWRHALDHLMRAKTAELGNDSSQYAPDYTDKQFSKALGHCYRAYFDTADWFSMVMRDRILHALQDYSPTAITAALPTYYSEMRLRINTINDEISGLREGKDIQDEGLIDGIDHYDKLLQELKEMCIQIESGERAILAYRHNEEVLDSLTQYDTETVTAALPTYYSETRPRIDTIRDELTALSQDNAPIGDRHNALLQELTEICEQVEHAKGALKEHDRARSRSEKKKWIWTIAGGIVVGAALILFGLLKSCAATSSDNDTRPPASAQPAPPR